MDIIGKIDNGKVYGYDCGSTSAAWVGYNGDMYDITWFVVDWHEQGKIIRVTSENNTTESNTDNNNDEKQFTGGTEKSRIQIVNEDGRYKIKHSYKDEEFEVIKKLVDPENKGEYSDTEIAIIAALMEGGADFSRIYRGTKKMFTVFYKG